MGEKAQGPVKAALEDQPKKTELDNLSPSPSTPNLSPETPPTLSTTTSSTTTTSNKDPTTISRTREEIIAGHVKMADNNYSLFMLLGILAMIPATLAALIKMGVSWKGFLLGGAILSVVLWVSLTLRMLDLKLEPKYQLPRRLRRNLRRKANRATTTTTPSKLLDDVPAAYFLFVLGSGGHTTEMFELIRQTCAPAPNVHRRYVFTTGDNNSLNAAIKTEERIAEKFGDNGGTWDAYQVKRARNVHQPFYTAWFTALESVVSIHMALTTVPDHRMYTALEQKLFKFPHAITTNGPGNGVITACLARLLKVFGVAPNNCMKVIFIETWAHVSTLSLTGKIFHWMNYFGGVVDLYLVQHGPLAEKYGYPLYDFITPGERRNGVVDAGQL
ncbi:oligosaccharide biosynthesis protein Alg14 like-domain-containing protein [Coniochaeta sp. 2T2.1]|nr:oligosaccharide biosynthesis protein Alg14 like-domain-containing protein [Coniochaeta sp. 2T2.1]